LHQNATTVCRQWNLLSMATSQNLTLMRRWCACLPNGTEIFRTGSNRNCAKSPQFAGIEVMPQKMELPNCACLDQQYSISVNHRAGPFDSHAAELPCSIVSPMIDDGQCPQSLHISEFIFQSVAGVDGHQISQPSGNYRFFNGPRLLDVSKRTDTGTWMVNWCPGI
jgi:hypothetical protein